MDHARSLRLAFFALAALSATACGSSGTLSATSTGGSVTGSTSAASTSTTTAAASSTSAGSTTSAAASSSSSSSSGSSSGGRTTGSSTGSSSSSTTAGTTTGAADAGPPPVQVLTFANGNARAGVFVDAALTQKTVSGLAADGGLSPDPTYTAAVAGRVYASPLFLEKGVKGQDAVFVAAESNNVYAFDTVTGKALWTTSVGSSAQLSNLSCGNIGTIGITATPAISLAHQELYLDAMVETSDGGGPKHDVLALALDTGNIDWTIEMDSALIDFSAKTQNSRSGLLVEGDTLYVPYSGHWGDCGDYHGRVVAIPLSAPAAGMIYEFKTAAAKGGIWAPNGVASDGLSLYTVTGNTAGAPDNWDGGLGEAALRLPLGTLAFSGMGTDYFVRKDFLTLDHNDEDFSSNGTALFDLPPALSDGGVAQLLFAIGKTHNAYLLDRTNLGGSTPLAELDDLNSDDASGGMIAYTTPNGTYLGFNSACWLGGNDTLGVIKVAPGNPPTLSKAFCVDMGAPGEDNGGSPIATFSDGTHDGMVWGLGAAGDNQLRAFDADTGALLATSSGLKHITHWISPIVAKGTIYVAGDNQLYAIRVK